MKLYRALRDIQLAGDFFVREIFQQRIQHFLFAPAQVGHGVRLQPAPLARQNGIHESREQLPRHPKPAISNQGQRANQLLPCFHVGEQPLHTQAQQRKAVGFRVVFADDN